MTKKILNLTQHVATSDQIEAGVVEPEAEMKKEIQRLLTFDELPSRLELLKRADDLTALASQCGAGCAMVMIGGAPFFMPSLEKALFYDNIRPCYSFSKREVTETTSADGKITKTAIFKHVGWVEV